jgi:hypothetical protein
MSINVEFGVAIAAYAVEDFWTEAKRLPKVMGFIRGHVQSIVKDTQCNICLSGETGWGFWEDDGGSHMKQLLDALEDTHDDCYRIILCVFDETDSSEDWGSFTNHEFELYIKRELLVNTEDKEEVQIPDGIVAMKEAINEARGDSKSGV